MRSRASKPLESGLRIGIAVALTVAAAGSLRAESGSEASPAKRVELETGEAGVSGLRVGGRDLLSAPGPEVVRVAFAGESAESRADPRPTAERWQGEKRRRVLRFEWGEVSCRYRVRENRVGVRVRVRNRSEKPVGLLELRLLTLDLGEGVSTGPSRNNVGGATVVPATWAGGVLALCNEQVRRPLRVGLEASEDGRVEARLTAGTAPGGPRRAYLERRIGPGETDEYRLSLRFGSADRDPLELGREVFEAYRKQRDKPSVAALVYRNGEIHGGASDAVAVELASSAGFRVVERTELSALLEEQSLASLSRSRQIRLGRFAGADYLALVTLRGEGGRTRLSVVNALTGAELSRTAVEAGLSDLRGLAGTVRKVTRKAIANRPEQSLSTEGAIALLPPRGAIGSSPERERIDGVLREIASRLREGRPLVHRLHPEAFSKEQRLAEEGFVEDADKALPLLGARFLASFQLLESDGSPAIVATLTDARRRSRVGRKQVDLNASDGKAAGKRLAAWLTRKMEEAEKQDSQPDRASQEPSGLTPRALSLLFRVVSLHNQGRYTEGLCYLARLFRLEPEIIALYRWNRSCFRRLGFGRVAEWVEHELQKKRSRLEPLEAGSAIGLAGVSAPTSRAHEARLTRLLTRSIHNRTGKPVLVNRDLGALQREYDVLVGRENTRGTTWRFAPNITPDKVVTAELVPAAGGYSLRLYLTPIGAPGEAIVTRIPLGHGSQASWVSKIPAAIEKLLNANRGRAEFPPPVPRRSEELLRRVAVRSNALWSEYRIWAVPSRQLPRRDLLEDADSLERLRANPATFGGNADDLVGPRLKAGALEPFTDWVARRLPKSHPYTPWFRLYRVERYFRAKGTAKSWAKQRRAFRKIAEQYPDHPAGLVAAYKVTLYSIDPFRLHRLEKRLRKLLMRMRKLREHEFSFDGQSVRKAIARNQRLIEFAQGQKVKLGVHPEVQGLLVKPEAGRLHMHGHPDVNWLIGRFETQAAARMMLNLLGGFPESGAGLSPNKRIRRFRRLVESTSNPSIAAAYAFQEDDIVRSLLRPETLGASNRDEVRWVFKAYHEVLRQQLKLARQEGRAIDSDFLGEKVWAETTGWLENHRDEYDAVYKDHRGIYLDLITRALRSESDAERDVHSVHEALGKLGVTSTADARELMRQVVRQAWRVPAHEKDEWPDEDAWPDPVWFEIQRLNGGLPIDKKISGVHKPFVDLLLRRYSRENEPPLVQRHAIELFFNFLMNLIVKRHYEDARRVIDRTVEMMQPWKQADEPTYFAGPSAWVTVYYCKSLIEYRLGNRQVALKYAKKARGSQGLRDSFGVYGFHFETARIEQIVSAIRHKPYEKFESPFELVRKRGN